MSAPEPSKFMFRFTLYISGAVLRNSLYIPFTDFQVNNLDGQKVLYENLVQSGPAYKLVVHESPNWLEIKDKMPNADMIEIIPDKRAQEYKDMVNDFFSPIADNAHYYGSNEQKMPIENLTTDLRRALSYVLIAHDYKATIYEDDFVNDIKSEPRLSVKLSNTNTAQKVVFSEEIIKRVKFVEDLVCGYEKGNVETISVNRDARIFNDLIDLLDKEQILNLSEQFHLFGMVSVSKDLLIHNIKEAITQLLKNEWFPYLAGGTTIALSYYYSLLDLEPALSFLTALGAKILGRFDLREYAPPIQDPQLFRFGMKELGIFSYKPFNYEYKIFVPKR